MQIFLTHTPDALRNYYGAEALAALRELGEVRLNSGDQVLDSAALAAAASGCQIVVSDRQTPVDAEFFARATGLQAVVRCAVDIRNIAVDAASAQGVLVTRATPGFADSVAELTIGFMIDLARGATDAVIAYRGSLPQRIRPGLQLAGTAVGIIGYGAIGSRVAALTRALNMTVLVADPGRTIEEAGIEQVDLAGLLRRSRFVICLATATEATENLMNAAAFAAMPAGSFFINMSRGELVDEAALEQALARGHLAGAALDVGRAPDQMPSPALARRPDVLATPHIAGLTPQAVQHQAFETVRQVAAIGEGRLPPGAVNPDAATRIGRPQEASR